MNPTTLNFHVQTLDGSRLMDLALELRIALKLNDFDRARDLCTQITTESRLMYHALTTKDRPHG